MQAVHEVQVIVAHAGRVDGSLEIDVEGKEVGQHEAQR